MSSSPIEGDKSSVQSEFDEMLADDEFGVFDIIETYSRGGERNALV